MARMEWGIDLPHRGRQAGRRPLIRFAQLAEELGFDSVWVCDHIAWPPVVASKYPYSDDGAFASPPDLPWFDPIGSLFFVAGCTERVKLGSTVLVLGYRPPMLTAKAMASLDALSDGRVILGVGIGWMREEYDVLSMPFDHRGARANEQLELFRVLFTEARPKYDGHYYAVPEIGFEPKPVKGSVPIWVGGGSEAAFRRTARFGDAFHAAFQPLHDVAAAWRRVQELCEEEGRSPADVHLTMRLYLDPDGSMPPHKSIGGSPEHMVDTAGEWAAIGVDHIVLDPGINRDLGARQSAMEGFMADVAPRVG